MNRKGFAQTLHEFVVVKSFDRTNLLMVACDCESDAGADWRAVDEDRAGAAYAMLATQVGPSKIIAIAKKIAQMRSGRDLTANCAIVDCEFNDRHRNSG